MQAALHTAAAPCVATRRAACGARRVPAAAAAASLQELPASDFIFCQEQFLDNAEDLRQFYEEKVILDALRATTPAQADKAAQWTHTLDSLEQRSELSAPRRTPANAFFPPALYRPLKAALVEYGERTLGCRGLAPLWLTYHTSACSQTWACVAPTHGPFPFALSLTRWEERGFSGGETMLLQPNVWATDETTIIEPTFNQLIAFDARVPSAVRRIQGGTDDPLDCRVTLTGYFSRPAPFFTGSLTEQEAGPAVRGALQRLQAALGQLAARAAGTVTLRLQVSGATGRVQTLDWLTNTLIAQPARGREPWRDVDEVLALIGEQCLDLQLPVSADGGDSWLTLPVEVSTDADVPLT